MEEIVKTGKYYKIESHIVNGVRYFYLCSKEEVGYIIVTRCCENILLAFEVAEREEGLNHV